MNKTKKKETRGRPRVLGGYIAFNVKIPPEVWAALKARAERETQHSKDGHEVTMSDVARIALAEWLLATQLGQRPSIRNIGVKDGSV